MCDVCALGGLDHGLIFSREDSHRNYYLGDMSKYYLGLRIRAHGEIVIELAFASHFLCLHMSLAGQLPAGKATIHTFCTLHTFPLFSHVYLCVY